MEIAAEQDEASIMDEGKAAHDEATVNSVKGQAITTGRDLGLLLSSDDEKIALGVFPKVIPLPFLMRLLTGILNICQVAGLARRAHDYPTLQEKFEKLVDAQTDFDLGQKRTLTRRVPTRWNSDLACLAAHVAFETPVKQLTSDSSNKLKQYAFTEQQWRLSKPLGEVLEVNSESLILL
jgi:hypothetical protein